MALRQSFAFRERLKSLPLFPLPDTVLIPGALLPLQIIDDRHRKLVEDCLASDRLLAIVLLAPSHEPGGLVICRTVGVGYIQSHEELDDGRLLVLVEGRTRARIIEELPGPEPYLVARAVPIEEEKGTTDAEIFASVWALRHLVMELARRLPDGSAQPLAVACVAEADAGRLADLLAAALLLESLQRQRYLEEVSVIKRLDFVIAMIAEVLRVVGGSGQTSAPN